MSGRMWIRTEFRVEEEFFAELRALDSIESAGCLELQDCMDGGSIDPDEGRQPWRYRSQFSTTVNVTSQKLFKHGCRR